VEDATRDVSADNGFKPSLISWNLTKRCNLRCPHCYIEAGAKAEGARIEDELTTDECLATIDDMKELGTEMLILTGGEPLLRKDIYDIASYASSQGMWVVMGTNGVLINEPVAKKMVECGVKGVGISIDSTNPEVHNTFRGGPDAWEHSVRALRTCRDYGLEVLVQTTVMEMNYDEIPAMLEFARDQGAWSFNLYFLIQTGRGQKMNDLSAARTEEMLTFLANEQDRYRPMLVRAKCAPHFKRVAYEAGLGGIESGGCMAGTEYLRITPEGDITPCPYMPLTVGNLRERSFREIWEEAPELVALRDPEQLKGRCGSCEYKELCGGCRCRAYAQFGDYLQEDPGCSYEPRGGQLEFKQLEWSREARARLERIPIQFIRNKVERGVEAYAGQGSASIVTVDIMKRALAGFERPPAFGKAQDEDQRLEVERLL
jgi:radical SAM protein with 4Fe4S-binding SPASM domain